MKGHLNPNWGWPLVQGLTILPVVAFWALVYGLLVSDWVFGLLMGLGFAWYASRAARRIFDNTSGEPFVYEPRCAEVDMFTPSELWPVATRLRADMKRISAELGIKAPDLAVLPCCLDEPAFIGTAADHGTITIGQRHLKLPYDQALSIVAHELGHAASPWLHIRAHSRALFTLAQITIEAPFVVLASVFGKRARTIVAYGFHRFNEALMRPARLLQARLSREAEFRADAVAADKTSVDAAIEALRYGREPRMAHIRQAIQIADGILVIEGKGMISPKEDTSPTRSHPLLERRIAALEALRDNDKTNQ